MFPKPRYVLLFLVAVFASLPVSAHAQSPVQGERIAASFVLALGRTPTADEIGRWMKEEPGLLADLVARHRRQLQGDPAAERAVVVKASQDAFGRVATEEETRSLSGGGTYADLMQHHLRWLRGHPTEYEQVMHRAYRLLLRRDAYSVEIEYWKGQPVLSFALLAGCIDNWARRNQPGLMATTGVASVSVNSACLATVRLSPSVAVEARAAAGLVPPSDAAMAFAVGRTIVAPGAEYVASVAGIAFVAAGAANLLGPGNE